MNTYPSRTDANNSEPRMPEAKVEPVVRRFGVVIPVNRVPGAAHDEVTLSCTAYGMRMDMKKDEQPEERRILSSCEFDERRI